MASTTVKETASATSAIFEPSCTTAVPGKYGNVPFDACNSYYNFNPDFAPAVAVAVIFGILTVTHLVLAVVFKKRYCWVIIMGTSWEFIAFTLHALGSHGQQNVGYATAHQLLYLLAPLWINAFVYMTFARMVHYFLPGKTVWRVKGASMAKYFVWADILAFLVQAVGGMMAGPSSSDDATRIGINIYMGGMGLQEAFILGFLGLMVLFHRQAQGLDSQGLTHRRYSWRLLLFALYGALVAITVRIIYRICEFAGGVKPSNPIPFHEAYSYALDAFPMMVAILLLAVFHPGRSLVGPESDFPRLSRKEKKAVKKERKAEKKAHKAAKKQGQSVNNVGELSTSPNGDDHYGANAMGSFEEDREYHAVELQEHSRR